MADRIKFFKTALFSEGIGAIARSSKYVIEGVLAELGNQELHQIVEYGPGDGVMTKELLKRLSPSGKLLAVDASKDFFEVLKSIKDPRLILVRGTIQEVAEDLAAQGFGSPQLVVSSIPFSSLSTGERQRIIQLTHDSLPPGGKFIVFHQYSRLMLAPLRRVFQSVNVRLEPRNVLPCFIFSATKAGD